MRGLHGLAATAHRLGQRATCTACTRGLATSTAPSLPDPAPPPPQRSGAQAAPPAPRLQVYRSLWNLLEAAPGGAWWRGPTGKPLAEDVLQFARQRGYDGVEASLDDLSRLYGVQSIRAVDAGALKATLADNGLSLICGVYTSWRDYEGTWDSPSVHGQLRALERVLRAADEFGPVHVNCHSGSDAWSFEETRDYIEGALEIESRLIGISISHETHRARCLANPWQTQRLLEEFKDLKLTADFSHWALVCERLFDDERGRAMMRACAARSTHIHSRIGTPQACQVADPQSPEHAEVRACYEEWWDLALDAQVASGKTVLTMTPEWGPPPYAPLGSDLATTLRDVAAVCDTQAARERARFSSNLERRIQLQPTPEQQLPEQAPAPQATPKRDTLIRSTWAPAHAPLPVIDAAALVDCHGREEMVRTLHEACETQGFFYVVNHGIPQSLLDDMRECAREFFLGPQADKDALAITASEYPEAARGYQGLGHNITLERPDQHEALDFYREPRRGEQLLATIIDCPPHLQRWMLALLCGKNEYPRRPERFESVSLEYQEQMLMLSLTIMSGIIEAMHLPPFLVSSQIDASFWAMRCIGYPAATAQAGAAPQGCGEHTDYGLLTIVNQDPIPGCLQVQRADGQWLDADPIPGALVVNLGDCTSILTGGQYKSTPHRVVNAHADYRVSTPFFFEPNFDARICSMVPPEDPEDELWCETPNDGLHYGHHLLAKLATNFARHPKARPGEAARSQS